MDLDSVYSKCTACYKELDDSDKEFNLKEENANYPVCVDCIKEAANSIAEILEME